MTNDGMFKNNIQVFRSYDWEYICQFEVKFKQDVKPKFCKPMTVPIALQNEFNHAYDADGKPTMFNEYGWLYQLNSSAFLINIENLYMYDQ